MDKDIPFIKILSYLNIFNIKSSDDFDKFFNVFPIAIIFSVLLFIVIKKFIIKLRSENMCDGWVPVQATIIKSIVDCKGIVGEVELTPEIEYKYTVDDKIYKSTNIPCYLFDHLFNYNFAERITKRYPVGSQTEIYYNPDKPSESILTLRGEWIVVLNYFLLGSFCFFGFFITSALILEYNIGALGIILLLVFIIILILYKLKRVKTN